MRSSRGNHAYQRRRSNKAVILEQTDQAANRMKRGSAAGRPTFFDAESYPDRNTAVRCTNKIKSCGGLATRYDKTPDSYVAGFQLRGLLIWIRSLRPTT